MSLYSASKGSSAILGCTCLVKTASTPPLAASATRAPSVGSPISSPSLSTASEASTIGSRNSSSGISACPPTRVIWPSVEYPLPSIAYRRPTTAIWTAVIWFSVSVPVLSELIAEVEPRVSVEASRFMIAPTLASAWVPEARIVVTTAGRFSGMAPMAKATAALKTAVNVSPRIRFKTIDTISATPAIHKICWVSLSSCRVSGVLAACSSCSIPEMWPTSVAIPVAVTTNSPAPLVTLVFMYTMSVRSPSGVSAPSTVSVPFDTGRLSPVSADSATSSVAAFSSLPSAGTMSPASMATTSPGTSCPAGISASAPSRRTLALTIIICCSAATAVAAFPSCRKPSTALNTVSASSKMPVPSSFSGYRLPTPATSRTICIGSAYWRRNACHQGSAFPESNLFGPNRWARACTSAELRPRCASTRSAWRTRSAVSVCHAGTAASDPGPGAGAVTGEVTLASLHGAPLSSGFAAERLGCDQRGARRWRPALVPAAVGAEGVEADHVDRDDQQRPERVGRDEGHLRYGVQREHRHAKPPGELVTDHDPESGQQLKRAENQYRPAPGAQVTDDKAGACDEETRLRD